MILDDPNPVTQSAAVDLRRARLDQLDQSRLAGGLAARRAGGCGLL